MAEFNIHSPEEMIRVAKEILDRANSHPLFLIFGSLGSGKTTLVKALGTLLDFDQQVSSPTFSLVNEYESARGTIYHIDLYRLESLSEAIDIGIEEYIYGKQICLVEWPEIIETIVPEHHKIHIELLDNSTRKVLFS